MTTTRTIEINDLTPLELADLFCEMDGRQQAEFFTEVWGIAKHWPGAGWCQQSYAINQELDTCGREAIRVLAGHCLPELADGDAA